jgi:hypothetical protein
MLQADSSRNMKQNNAQHFLEKIRDTLEQAERPRFYCEQ